MRESNMLLDLNAIIITYCHIRNVYRSTCPYLTADVPVFNLVFERKTLHCGAAARDE